MNRTDYMQVNHRVVQRELGDRADAIRRQPWRIWRNRRLAVRSGRSWPSWTRSGSRAVTTRSRTASVRGGGE